MSRVEENQLIHERFSVMENTTPDSSVCCNRWNLKKKSVIIAVVTVVVVGTIAVPLSIYFGNKTATTNITQIQNFYNCTNDIDLPIGTKLLVINANITLDHPDKMVTLNIGNTSDLIYKHYCHLNCNIKYCCKMQDSKLIMNFSSDGKLVNCKGTLDYSLSTCPLNI